MGGKSKPTIGYWYKLLLHFGLCRGPIDALLEFRGGERAAWAGVATGGTLAINARELWGGEKAEGGIEGELDVMLGGADQMPSARLAARLGDMQSAFRGRACVAFEGLYGAFNPYPKAASFKVRRIFEGWDGDVCWYPEKAAIVYAGEAGTAAERLVNGNVSGGTGSLPNLITANSNFFVSGDETLPRLTEFRLDPYFGPYAGLDYPRRVIVRKESDDSVVWDSGWCGLTSDQAALNAMLFDEGRLDLAGSLSGSLTKAEVVDLGEDVLTVNGLKWEGYMAHFLQDGRPVSGQCHATSIWNPGLADSRAYAMNPAHIIFDALTAQEMQGEPTASIDAASFMAAADTFYAESFGLCARFNPATQTPEDFSQRICSIAGATLSRSRVDGKYYLAPRRGVHDLDALPILTDDDILEYEEEPSDPLEAVNQITIEWFDPIKKQKRTTTPIQALGAIQALGGVVAESLSYPEIPTEMLALRVGGRDLAQKATPLKRFRLTTNRVPYAWRVGDYFRLQAPRRGIADMVCEVGDIDAGTPRSGSMRLVAIQDVSRMPNSVYVEPEPGVDTSPSPVPTAPPAQRLVEAPYVDLAGDLPAGELSALAPDAGFLLAVAARPASGINYTLETAAGGEVLADRGTGDWCPTALVVEAGVRSAAQTAFTLTDGLDLDQVEVGTAALWGNELCRVDAIDAVAMTLSLGRGCGDTPPGLHGAGERIWFYDAWAASDRREYAAGETVTAKLRSRTSSQVLSSSQAATLVLELNERVSRPYAPGRLRISDDLIADRENPEAAYGLLTVAWAHRDRLLQSDQLIDAQAVSIGPEAGTAYTVRFYLDDELVNTESPVSGESATPYSFSANGLARIEVEAVRDGLSSWQAAIAEFTYLTEPPTVRGTDAGDTRTTDSGDRRITD